MKNVFKLIIAVAVSEMAGAVGSIFTAGSIDTWYTALAKPSFNPPNWVFAPVWTLLYFLMGVAAFLVWSSATAGVGEQARQEKRKVKIALVLFGVQLLLNALWSIIFFGLRSPGGALVEIVFLWLAIAATISAFAKVSKLAASLLVPYILWVSFALCLNYSIYTLN